MYKNSRLFIASSPKLGTYWTYKTRSVEDKRGKELTEMVLKGLTFFTNKIMKIVPRLDLHLRLYVIAILSY